ncbi:MAG: hypothetical protein LBR96_05140 [Treponema sp.]|jgi:hypothetical protein|nr:hypothetical protein [Treponema sp.]
MKKCNILVFLSLFYTALLGALPAQKLVYPGEWPYEALKTLSMEQHTLFFSSYALSVAQFRAMLADLDADAFSESGRELYEKLSSWLDGPSLVSFEYGPLSIDGWPAVQTEFYVRSNKNIDWITTNRDRNPFIVIPAAISVSPWVTMELDFEAAQNYNTIYKDDNYTNFPLPDTNYNMPRRAYLALGYPFTEKIGVQFRMGIGEDFYGDTHTGSIILSDYMKDISYGKFSLYSPVIAWTSNVMQLSVDKYFYYHTLEARLLRRFTISYLEGLMVNAPLELRFLNPVMIYHSLAAYSEYEEYNRGDPDQFIDDEDSRVASFFAAKAEFEPVSNIRLYALWALNELQTPQERRDDPEVLRADSMGFQLGTEFQFPYAGGYWYLGAEGVYNSPFFYVSKDSRWSFYKPETAKSGSIRNWTGSPFGPDSAAAALWGGYKTTSWSLTGNFLFVASGERSGIDIFDTDTYHPWRSKNHDEVFLFSPTGIVYYTWQPSVKAAWSPRDWLSLQLMLGYSAVQNYGHRQDRLEHGFEGSLSVRIAPNIIHARYGKEEGLKVWR